MTSEFAVMGFRINPTIEAEINKRSAILDKMNEQSFWTKEMEAIEIALQNEINDLLAARHAYGAYFD
jgi:hypothetical protein